MSRILTVDIGAGTMDVLYYDTSINQHYKAVAKSPIRSLGEKVESLPGNLLITGTEMGGGALSKVLSQRAQEAEVIMSMSSAATVHHNMEKVRSWGIKVVDDKEAEDLKHSQDYNTLTTGDLEVDRLEHIMEGLGVPFSFDVVGLCAQYHGRATKGVSHLDYRHNIFKASLDENPFPHALLYRNDEVPATLSRLICMAESAKTLATKETYIMDSGMAAILGASLDPRTKQKDRALVLDVATSHTLGAAIERGELA